MRLLQELQSANSPEAEAFAENLCYAAVESSNAGIVEYLLQKDAVDLNKLVCDQQGQRRTPIERAVELGSMEVTRVLIHAKVDPNKTLGRNLNQGALEIAMSHYNQSYLNIELVRMLLEAGAILNIERLNEYHLHCSSDALVFLINFYFNASATRHIGTKVLELVLREAWNAEFHGRRRRKPWDLAWNIIIGMVEIDFTNAINILTETRANLSFALDIAAEQGHLELVKTLLRSGTIPTVDFLSRGIKSGNEELVRYLLDAGADASGRCSTIARDDTGRDDCGSVFVPPPHWARNWGSLPCRSYTTPLAEAIRLGNFQILELLQSRGARLQIVEKSRFSAALIAASEVGNIRFVRELLDIRSVHELLDMEPILDGHELIGPLLASVRGSQEEIVTMILDNGATAIRSKVMESLRSHEVEVEYYNPGFGDLPIQQALLHASKVGHISIVQKLLDLTSTFGGLHLSSSLLASIKGNHKQVALMLLDAGANPSSECVAAALNVKNWELVKSLLDADVYLRGSHLADKPCDHFHFPELCSRPLLVLKATNFGAYSITERIIAYGADVNEFCQLGKSGTALVAAVRKQDIKLAKLLLDSGADISLCASYPRGVTPLTAAIMQGDVTMTDFLLARGANSADEGALYAGILRNDLLTERLLEVFAKQYPHGKKGFGCELIWRAIELGNLNIIRRLLLLPVDLDGFLDTSTFLDELDDAFPGATLLTPLGWAIIKDQGEHLDIVRIMLEAGCDPNSTVLEQYVDSTFLKTALLVAINTGNLRIVRLLVDHGARVNCLAAIGVNRTPLQFAAQIGSFDIVEYLLREGAEVNAPPARNRGATALQLAAIGGYIGIAELLLNAGADPNAPAAKVDGRTAIEGAAEFGRVDMLRLLTNGGAMMDWRQFERASWMAEKNGHVATKKYLKSLFHETVSVEELLS
jgi:ankyrin repeat protein